MPRKLAAHVSRTGEKPKAGRPRKMKGRLRYPGVHVRLSPTDLKRLKRFKRALERRTGTTLSLAEVARALLLRGLRGKT